ncbi:hypothetical protein LIIV107777_12785 [Listeria ivanovii subsp. ivanovii]|nr:hypothetical protein AX25_02100 [Listeria ivanovii WSLC3009]SNV36172.1 Uncharacterised protein [Listeria ivanovii subsp. ivanovii]SNV82025.1 Uncharacterised protein [Listeria ivanovii subsp. ivanovii]
MTGLGVLLFLAGIGVLIFGILRHREVGLVEKHKLLSLALF